MINLSNDIYITKQIEQYKVYVGKGNNFEVIKNNYRRRFWWKITADAKENQSIWTPVSYWDYLKKLNSP